MNCISKELDYVAIGSRIRKYRWESKISQEELAEAVGISTTHMSHIETGATKLSLVVLANISRALNVSTDLILNGEKVVSKTSEIDDRASFKTQHIGINPLENRRRTARITTERRMT